MKSAVSSKVAMPEQDSESVGFAAVSPQDLAHIPWAQLELGRYTAEQRQRGARSFVLRTLDEQRSMWGAMRLFRDLCETGAATQNLVGVTRLIRDSALHILWCRKVVDLLGTWPQGQIIIEEPLLRNSADAASRILKTMVAEMCLGKTLAAELLQGRLLHAPDPVAHEILSRMAQSKTRSADAGWAWLSARSAGLSAVEGERINRWLPRALASAENELGGVFRVPGVVDRYTHHPFGSLSPTERAQIVARTLQTIVVPRLADCGFRSHAAWENRRLLGEALV